MSVDTSYIDQESIISKMSKLNYDNGQNFEYKFYSIFKSFHFLVETLMTNYLIPVCVVQ